MYEYVYITFYWILPSTWPQPYHLLACFTGILLLPNLKLPFTFIITISVYLGNVVSGSNNPQYPFLQSLPALKPQLEPGCLCWTRRQQSPACWHFLLHPLTDQTSSFTLWVDERQRDDACNKWKGWSVYRTTMILLRQGFLNLQVSLEFNVKRIVYFGDKKLVWTIGKKLIWICVGWGWGGAVVKYWGKRA